MRVAQAAPNEMQGPASPADLEALRRAMRAELSQLENKLRAELLQMEKRYAGRLNALAARSDRPNAEIGDLQARTARIEEFLLGRAGSI